MKNSTDWGSGFWWMLWVGFIALRMYLAYHKNHDEFKPYVSPLPQVQFNSGLPYESPFEKYNSLGKPSSLEFGSQPRRLGNFGSRDVEPIPAVVPQP